MTAGEVWHGRLPLGWESAPLKAMARARSGATPDSSNEAFWCEPEEGLPWVAIADMSGRDAVHETAKGLTREGQEVKGLSAGRPGTLLFAMYASVGEVARLSIPATWNQAILGLTPYSDRAVSRYLQYALMAIRPHLALDFRSNTQNNLNAWQVAHLRMPCPPLSAQQAIADFLDRETAQIDAMIEAQEQLLHSVMERRSAIRRRGFFALREIETPRPLKHLSVKVSGSVFPLEEQGEQGLALPFHKVAALAHRDSRGVITFESDSIAYETSSRLGARVVPTGSSLMAKIGAASLLARVGINANDCCIDNNMVAFAPRAGVSSRFLYHALCDLDIYPYINQSTIPYMNERAIMSAPVPLPNLAVQQQLVDTLDAELNHGSVLVGECENAIALLQERREALITAAVTGRIDPETSIERIDPTTEKEEP